MERKIVIVAENSMYQVDYYTGAIRPYNPERLERDIELGYSVTVRPAVAGELDYIERMNYYRRPIGASEYNLELEGVL